MRQKNTQVLQQFQDFLCKLHEIIHGPKWQ